jgi:hypothetical protein
MCVCMYVCVCVRLCVCVCVCVCVVLQFHKFVAPLRPPAPRVSFHHPFELEQLLIEVIYTAGYKRLY